MYGMQTCSSRQLRGCIVLLMLAMIAIWVSSPALAGPSCEMTANSAMMNGSTGHPCKGDNQSCLTATICCQTTPSSLVPMELDWLPTEWREVVYPSRLTILVGLHPKPELHPPSILA